MGGIYKRFMSVPDLLAFGGPMMWVIVLASSLAIAVFIERIVHYHRAQIHSGEFLNGIKNVLKGGNVVEAISICEATPGPVARLVKVAIINREGGKDGIREGLEEAGLMEVPRLEKKLSLLATVAQIAPLLGLMGTVLGFIEVFQTLTDMESNATTADLAKGIWQGLICTAAGLGIAIPSYAGYNYLVSRVNSIVLDMEKASMEIINIIEEVFYAPR